MERGIETHPSKVPKLSFPGPLPLPASPGGGLGRKEGPESGSQIKALVRVFWFLVLWFVVVVVVLLFYNWLMVSFYGWPAI